MNCSGQLYFDIDQQKLKCDHCDSSFDINEFEDKNSGKAKYTSNIFVCPQCGGEIYTQDNDLTGRCSYCGTTQVFQSRVETISRPQWIIPFQKDKSYCKSLYTNAIKKAIFAPKELKNPEYIDGIRGVYMPYWFYDCKYDMDLHLSGMAKKLTKIDRKGNTITYYRHNVDTHLNGHFIAMQEDASSWYSDEISDNVRPFHFPVSSSGIQPFHPAYMSGFYGETADVESPDKKEKTKYEEQASKRPRDYVMHSLQNTYIIDRGFEQIKQPTESHFVLGLLPVWFLSYNKGGRVSYSVINGQTGRFAADFLIDLKKFLLATLALAAALFMILNLFWVMRPEYVAMLASMGSLWALQFNLSDLTEIARKECGMLGPRMRKHVYKPARLSYFFRYTQLIPLLCVVLIIWGENSGYIDRYPNGLITWLPMILTAWALAKASYEMWKNESTIRYIFKYTGAKVFPGHYLAWFSILVALIVQVFHPVSDNIYFLVGYLCMGASLISFLGLILTFNRMATRRMPQFEHMGGDDSAK